MAIARTLLKNPSVLLLDEATSALDSMTESSIQEQLSRTFTGRTSVIIAHRLSTIVTADQILVLSGGDIMEVGTHAELLQTGGRYAELWNHQSKNRDGAAANGAEKPSDQ